MAEIAIGLMCKIPAAGLSKTRLAATIGEDAALSLASAFLSDAISALRSASEITCSKAFCFFRPSTAADRMRSLAGSGIVLLPQDEADLGHSMLSALNAMRKQCPRGAVLFGSDVPTLPHIVLAQAVEILRNGNTDAVFGPSEDGGYYLAGIRNSRAAPLFAPMFWSTSSVMDETRKRASAAGLRIHEVERWYDIDTADSLARLQSDLRDDSKASKLGPARATREALGLLSSAGSTND